MGLKAVFKNMKKEEGLLKQLDRYLLSIPADDSDRARNVNAPSAAGDCNRANFYKRTGVQGDSLIIEPRSRRIFDNGSHVHDRLQEYLDRAGILLIKELPVIHEPLNIQGHSDGLVKIDDEGLAILEIKSINDGQFQKLIDAKPDHKYQGMTYLFATEQRRQNLRMHNPTLEDLIASEEDRKQYYASKYQHFKNGRRFTREEKISMQVNLNMSLDRILWHEKRNINRVVFVYENKNDQSIKEYVLYWDDFFIAQIMDKYTALNKAVKSGKAPKREGKNKSDSYCRWCNFRLECWG